MSAHRPRDQDRGRGGDCGARPPHGTSCGGVTLDGRYLALSRRARARCIRRRLLVGGLSSRYLLVSALRGLLLCRRGAASLRASRSFRVMVAGGQSRHAIRVHGRLVPAPPRQHRFAAHRARDHTPPDSLPQGIAQSQKSAWVLLPKAESRAKPPSSPPSEAGNARSNIERGASPHAPRFVFPDILGPPTPLHRYNQCRTCPAPRTRVQEGASL